MSRRGFTMIEIAIVLSISAVLVPICFMFLRSFDSQYREALARAQAAAQMRGLSEELRRDLRLMHWENASSTTLVGAGACPRVEYTIGDEGVVFRHGPEGCGPTRAVARGVASIKAVPAGLEVVFAARTGAPQPFNTTFIFGAPR